jgi:hypothetical protein
MFDNFTVILTKSINNNTNFSLNTSDIIAASLYKYVRANNTNQLNNQIKPYMPPSNRSVSRYYDTHDIYVFPVKENTTNKILNFTIWLVNSSNMTQAYKVKSFNVN